MGVTVALSLISHTNAGKTTLARTLLGRDVGEVRDEAHVTQEAESWPLVDTPEGDALLLWDTPGFGDSARLAKRLAQQGNPIGWFLTQVWDRFRDRTFWLTQKAVVNVRDEADVVLYLVNAAEEPGDAGYLAPELAVLEWIGKPAIVLLNQTGPPRPHEEEAADAAAAPSDEPVEVASAAPAPAKLEKPKVEEAAPAAPIVVAAADAPESEPAAEEVAPPSEARPSMPPAPVAPVEPMKPSAEPTPSPSNTANPVTREATSPPAPMSPPPASSSADARRKALSAKLQPEPASSGSLLSLATSPLGLGVIGAAVLLLGSIVVMRRRRGGEDEDPLYTVMSAEDAGAPMEAEIADEPAPVRAAPIWEPDAFEASEPTPKQGPRQLALGSRPAPEPAPEPEPEEIAPPDDSDSIFGSAPEPIAVAERAPVVEPVPVIAQPAAPASQETERRIAELERRIEQLAEARERLERQVAAQTEELRVQRAAIARTQRVVRSIAKTEDMATEPVPRAPSA